MPSGGSSTTEFSFCTSLDSFSSDINIVAPLIAGSAWSCPVLSSSSGGGGNIRGDRRGGEVGGALTRNSLGRRRLLQSGTGAGGQQSGGAGGGGGRESGNRLASVRRGVRKQVATQQRVLPGEGV